MPAWKRPMSSASASGSSTMFWIDAAQRSRAVVDVEAKLDEVVLGFLA